MKLVFLHGSGCSGLSFYYQLRHFRTAKAIDLPGHPDGRPCTTIGGYVEWVRGFIRARRYKDVALCGHSMGGAIALQYALDYPDEVQGLALMTIAMRPKQRRPEDLQFRLDAAADAATYEQWLAAMDAIMHFIAPELRARLLARHRQVGPVAQYRDLVVIDRFDVRDRIHTLQAPLLLIQGVDDPLSTGDYESEIQRAVPGSQLIQMKDAGHFPMVEKPAEVNAALDAFLAEIG